MNISSYKDKTPGVWNSMLYIWFTSTVTYLFYLLVFKFLSYWLTEWMNAHSLKKA